MSDENSLENQLTDDELKSMGKLYAQMVNDPKTRMHTLRATKIISPNTPIPELDVFDRVGAAVKPHIDKVDALEKKFIEKDAENNVLRKREELYDLGHSKAEVEAIEKLMLEKRIPDHKTAAEFYKLQAQSAPVTPASYVHRPTLPIDKDAAKKAGGFKNFFLQDAHSAVDDLRSGKIKLNG